MEQAAALLLLLLLGGAKAELYKERAADEAALVYQTH
jgi:hypothetical protein